MTYRREVEVETAPPVVIDQRPVYRTSPASVISRWVVFIFGLIQLLIALRIILLLVAARQSNDIVSFIYSVSEVFVAPFRGILRIDEVQAGATALDVGAIVALIGWFVIELIILALLRVFRPRATAA